MLKVKILINFKDMFNKVTLMKIIQNLKILNLEMMLFMVKFIHNKNKIKVMIDQNTFIYFLIHIQI